MKNYTALRKDEILPFVRISVDLDDIMPSKISQMGKDKNHMISLTDISKRENTKLHILKRNFSISYQLCCRAFFLYYLTTKVPFQFKYNFISYHSHYFYSFIIF